MDAGEEWLFQRISRFMDYTSFNIQEIFGWEGYHLHNFKSKDSNGKDIEYGNEEDGETRPIDKPLNKLEPEPEENDTVTESDTAKSILPRHSDILPRFFFAIPDERIRDERIRDERHTSCMTSLTRKTVSWIMSTTLVRAGSML